MHQRHNLHSLQWQNWIHDSNRRSYSVLNELHVISSTKRISQVFLDLLILRQTVLLTSAAVADEWISFILLSPLILAELYPVSEAPEHWNTNMRLWINFAKAAMAVLKPSFETSDEIHMCSENLISKLQQVESVAPAGRKLNRHHPEHFALMIIMNGPLTATSAWILERANKREKTVMQSGNNKDNLELWASIYRQTAERIASMVALTAECHEHEEQIQQETWMPVKVMEEHSSLFMS